MHFKVIMAFVDDQKTDAIMDAAREAGATGATVINNARGEGITRKETFFGLSLETQRDVLLFLVEEHMRRDLLDQIAYVAEFEDHPVYGSWFQVDVEAEGGVTNQIQVLCEAVAEKL